MTGAAKWLHRLEIVLMVAGISLLGVAFAATVSRLGFQASQKHLLAKSAVESPRPPGPAGARPIKSEIAASGTLGRITIPRVGVDAIVREGTDVATLALAVGHVRGTVRPGESGNTVLAGHRDTFFRGLRNIRVDDKIRFVAPSGTFDYRVISMRVVPPHETGVMGSAGNEELTLVTCHPFNFIGKAPDRFIVHANRVVE